MNNRKLSILNIDGVEGTGKTTQLNIMANHLKTLEIPIKLSVIDGSEDSIEKAISRTEVFLEENPNGIALNDGTIARAIVLELSTGIPHQDIEHKYRDLLFRLQVLEHKFGMSNLLLIPDNLDACDRRIRKRQDLFGEEVIGVKDTVLQNTLMNGFKMFDYSVLSRNLKFDVLTVDEDESIMKVHDNILKILNNSFEIKKGLE